MKNGNLRFSWRIKKSNAYANARDKAMPVQPFLKKDSSFNGTCFYLQLITYVHLLLQTIIPFLWVKIDVHFILMLVTDLEVFSSYISR